MSPLDRIPPIASATVTLRFTDGRIHTYEIHDGNEIEAAISSDDDYDEFPNFGRRPALVSSRIRIDLLARSTMAADALCTWTRLKPDADPS